MTPVETSPRSRTSRLRPLLLAGAVALLASACSSGPGTQEEFMDVLTRDGNLTEAEATCISDQVFEKYGEDKDALGKLSAAPDYEYLSGPDGIPGFTEFYDGVVEGCLKVGP